MIFSRIKYNLNLLAKDKRGAMSVIFGVVLFLMLLLSAISIDYSRVSDVRTRLQKIADAAAITAIQSYLRTQDLVRARKEVEKLITALDSSNLIKPGSVVLGLDVAEQKSKTTIKIRLSYKLDTTLLKVANKDNIDVGVSSHSEAKKLDTEVAVVMDISGSMRNNGRLIRAQGALRKFSSFMFGTFQRSRKDFAISLIPYAGGVHFGKGYEFLVNFPTLTSRLHPVSRNRITKKNWEGCLRYWSPAANGWTDSLVSPGSLQPMRPIYNIPKRLSNRPGFVIDKTKYDPWCPTKKNKVLEFAENSRIFLNAVNSLTYADGTSTDTGMAWGYRFLSPTWRGHFRGLGAHKFPLTPSPKGASQKHLVLLTDGKINVFRSHYNNHQAEKNFQKTCKNIGRSNIIIHVISYDITDARVNADLLECAVDNGGFYYHAVPSTIKAVFDIISGKLLKLRLVK